MDTDVLIVGGGPTGITLGIELARRGVNYRLIDVGRGPTDLTKAIGVQARTLETLDIYGQADNLIAKGNPIRRASIFDDGKKIARLDFSGIESRFPFLLIVPQSETERVLIETLERNGGKVERSTKLTSLSQTADRAAVVIAHESGSEERVNARWVIGCDGSHSAVRESIGLPFEGEDYAEGFMLADVDVDCDQPPEELQLLLHQQWLLAFFPMANGRCRMIADLPPEQAPMGKAPSLEECQRLVDERSSFPIRLSNADWTAYYRIHRRIVPRLQEGRVFLAGDSAHIHSPAAAQGMNTGIQDAFNLGWKLALASQDCASDKLLGSYNAERYPVERGVLTMTDVMLRIVSAKSPLVREIRDAVMPIISRSELFKKITANRVSEIAIEYKDSPIVAHYGHAEGARAGRRAPDCELQPVAGRSERLYELLRGGKFVLLADVRDGGVDLDLEAVAEILRPHADLFDSYAVGGSDLSADEFTNLAAIGGEFAGELGLTPGQLIAIRPDGYIGLRTHSRDAAEHLDDWLQSVFAR